MALHHIHKGQAEAEPETSGHDAQWSFQNVYVLPKRAQGSFQKVTHLLQTGSPVQAQALFPPACCAEGWPPWEGIQVSPNSLGRDLPPRCSVTIGRARLETRRRNGALLSGQSPSVRLSRGARNTDGRCTPARALWAPSVHCKVSPISHASDAPGGPLPRYPALHTELPHCPALAALPAEPESSGTSAAVMPQVHMVDVFFF